MTAAEAKDGQRVRFKRKQSGFTADAADVLFQPIDDALTPWAKRRAALDGKAVAPWNRN